MITKSTKETINLGKKLAKKLHGGEILALSGNLGAGKTTLIKGIAAGLGIKKIITSPTFVLMKVYKVKHKNIKRLVHIDCYRIKKPSDIIAIGATEYFGKKDTVTVIEWPEKIKKILPRQILKIKLEYKKNNQTRKIIYNI